MKAYGMMLARTAMRGAEKVQRTFTSPEDDWAPVMLTMDRVARATVVGFDPRWFDSDDSKDQLTDDALPAMLREKSAVALALVLSTWHLDTSDLVAAGRTPDDAATEAMSYAGRVSEHPLRREAVFVSALSATEHHAWSARISRAGTRPPILGRWERQPEGTGILVTGRFVEPLRQALVPQG